MSKWVIEKVELIKKTYLVESYGAPAAILAANTQAPTKVEILGEVTFDIHTINEYEYDKDWASKTPHQRNLDWIDKVRPDRSLDWIDKASGRDREGNGK